MWILPVVLLLSIWLYAILTELLPVVHPLGWTVVLFLSIGMILCRLCTRREVLRGAVISSLPGLLFTVLLAADGVFQWDAPSAFLPLAYFCEIFYFPFHRITEILFSGNLIAGTLIAALCPLAWIPFGRKNAPRFP